jgi:hypothetical protein
MQESAEDVAQDRPTGDSAGFEQRYDCTIRLGTQDAHDPRYFRVGIFNTFKNRLAYFE